MLENLNLTIIIAVVIAALVGFIAFAISGGKIKLENHGVATDSSDQERDDVTGSGEGGYYGNSK
jgi:flagellar basal body-associated protein FliL